jgi:hypothetical protein
MATIDQEWLKTGFQHGYDSGDVLAEVPNSVRLREEVLIGGSYREAFFKACFPYLRPDSRVLEIGPGRGSWTRAILEHLPDGVLETVDFADCTPWLQPERYGGRLICHRTNDFSLDCVPDDRFDFIWSFGVLCHHTIEQIAGVLASSFRKARRGACAVHEYAEWMKLYRSGRIGQIGELVDDNSHWWPSNSKESMAAAARAAGWRVIHDDLDLFERDGVIVLKKWV